MLPARVVLFTRFPTPGMAKTRLIPALGPEAAARLHRRLTERTVATVRGSGLALEIRTTGASPEEFRHWLGEVAVRDQGGGELGARLLAAAPPYPVILIGADAPDLSAQHLLEAEAALNDGRPVLGPAEDGGYWLLGLPRPIPRVFDGIPWGTEHVFGTTMRRFAAAGLHPVLLEPLADLDRPEDLPRWPDILA